MILLEVLAVFVALFVAFLVLLVVPERLYRRARQALADARRTRRISDDRRLVNGEEPLPPGVSLSEAYLYGARHDLPLAEAAWEIHRAETLARIRKATRRRRPGD